MAEEWRGLGRGCQGRGSMISPYSMLGMEHAFYNLTHFRSGNPGEVDFRLSLLVATGAIIVLDKVWFASRIPAQAPTSSAHRKMVAVLNYADCMMPDCFRNDSQVRAQPPDDATVHDFKMVSQSAVSRAMFKIISPSHLFAFLVVLAVSVRGNRIVALRGLCCTVEINCSIINICRAGQIKRVTR